jgi:hypothetical protein
MKCMTNAPAPSPCTAVAGRECMSGSAARSGGPQTTRRCYFVSSPSTGHHSSNPHKAPFDTYTSRKCVCSVFKEDRNADTAVTGLAIAQRVIARHVCTDGGVWIQGMMACAWALLTLWQSTSGFSRDLQFRQRASRCLISGRERYILTLRGHPSTKMICPARYGEPVPSREQ